MNLDLTTDHLDDEKVIDIITSESKGPEESIIISSNNKEIVEGEEKGVNNEEEDIKNEENNNNKAKITNKLSNSEDETIVTKSINESAGYLKILNETPIPMDKVRHLSFKGLPDTEYEVRALYWKLLFKYLPWKGGKLDWENSLKESRASYQEFVDELEVDPHDGKKNTKNAPPALDHPLSTERDSKWATYFQNQQVLEQIRKDIHRTHPGLHFFHEESGHRTHMMRALFIWAKLNPGVSYVQGMNELLSPIYYVFAQAPNTTKFQAEADTFFVFTSLMAEIRDNFTRSLDGTHLGILGTVSQFHSLLVKLDPELATDLDKKGISPQFYSLRWLSLLLSQEFSLPDTIRLWDSLFSDEDRFKFFHYVCSALVILQRSTILVSEFAVTMSMLQNYPPVDLNDLITKADLLRDGCTPATEPSKWPSPPIQSPSSSNSKSASTSAIKSSTSPSSTAGATIASFISKNFIKPKKQPPPTQLSVMSKK